MIDNLTESLIKPVYDTICHATYHQIPLVHQILYGNTKQERSKEEKCDYKINLKLLNHLLSMFSYASFISPLQTVSSGMRLHDSNPHSSMCYLRSFGQLLTYLYLPHKISLTILSHSYACVRIKSESSKWYTVYIRYNRTIQLMFKWFLIYGKDKLSFTPSK